MAGKLCKLRIFEDEEGKMNRSVEDVDGGILLVSQFTLYGEFKKGTRPSFTSSAGPEKAEQMYDRMVSFWKKHCREGLEPVFLPQKWMYPLSMMDR
jgi:D-aminoacyl-tRNA deacylase